MRPRGGGQPTERARRRPGRSHCEAGHRPGRGALGMRPPGKGTGVRRGRPGGRSAPPTRQVISMQPGRQRKSSGRPKVRPILRLHELFGVWCHHRRQWPGARPSIKAGVIGRAAGRRVPDPPAGGAESIHAARHEPRPPGRRGRHPAVPASRAPDGNIGRRAIRSNRVNTLHPAARGPRAASQRAPLLMPPPRGRRPLHSREIAPPPAPRSRSGTSGRCSACRRPSPS